MLCLLIQKRDCQPNSSQSCNIVKMNRSRVILLSFPNKCSSIIFSLPWWTLFYWYWKKYCTSCTYPSYSSIIVVGQSDLRKSWYDLSLRRNLKGLKTSSIENLSIKTFSNGDKWDATLRNGIYVNWLKF